MAGPPERFTEVVRQVTAFADPLLTGDAPTHLGRDDRPMVLKRPPHEADSSAGQTPGQPAR
jgi:hypothetical protein